MSDLRVVLFDLDDTLFDHSHATAQALARLRGAEPALAAWTSEELQFRHGAVLETLHQEVLAGALSIDAAREERFRRLLTAAASSELAARRAAVVAALYRDSYASEWRAVPGAVALLAALKSAGIGVTVVTNNLTTEQRRKLDGTGLAPHVDHLITSESVGVKKPDAAIFRAALDAAGARADEAVVLGDAWPIDVVGAQAAGIRAVWFNRTGLPSPDASVPQLHSLEPIENTMGMLTTRE